MDILRSFGTLFYIVPLEYPYKRVQDAPDHISQAVPYFILLIILEICVGKWKKYPLYNLRDTIMSFSLGTVQQLLGLFTKEMSCVPYVLLYDYSAPFRAAIAQSTTTLFQPLFSTLSLSASVPDKAQDIAIFVLGLLGCDLCYYFFHRLSHEWHFLWAAHSVHHSGERCNLATALRQGATQSLFSWTLYLPLAVLGLPPVHYIRHNRLNTLYQFWIHTEVIHRLPPFIELLFNTASHHRMHHRPPGNCNYAGVLIVWDRLFGTFLSEEHSLAKTLNNLASDLVEGKIGYQRGVVYGLAQPLNSLDPIFANLCHFTRQLKLIASKIGKRDTVLLKFLSKMFSKRVDHPVEIVTDIKRLAPDVVFDYEYYQLIRKAQEEHKLSVDDANRLLNTVQLPRSDDKGMREENLTPREVAFLKGRHEREGAALSFQSSTLLILHFIVTLGTAYGLMLFYNSPYLPVTSTLGKVIVALFCVLSLQLLKYY